MEVPVGQEEELEWGDRALDRHLGHVQHQPAAIEVLHGLVKLERTVERVEVEDVALPAGPHQPIHLLRGDAAARGDDQVVVVDRAAVVELHAVFVGLDHVDPAQQQVYALRDVAGARPDDVLLTVDPERDEEQPGLVLCGKQAIDNDMNATGQMLSALLGWSQATFASEVDIDGDKAVVTREVDGGLQTIKVSTPTIISVDLRLNEPRYASLPNIMKAKKKPLDEKTAADYGVDVTPRLEIVKTVEPAERAAGIIVGSVDELVAKLKEAGAV